MKNGIIYHRNISSAMFVVELDQGTYTVFESFSINEFHIGDQISGALGQLGTIVTLNATTHKTGTVIVRKINATLDEAMDYANLTQ